MSIETPTNKTVVTSQIFKTGFEDDRTSLNQDNLNPLIGGITDNANNLKQIVEDINEALDEVTNKDEEQDKSIEDINIRLDEVTNKDDDQDEIIVAIGEELVRLADTLNGKADIESPTFTGSPKAINPPLFDNSARIATTFFVNNALTNMISEVNKILTNLDDDTLQ